MEQNKKVAIVSYNIHSNHMNYGAALHSYAFQQYLKGMGVESIIIDYIPKVLEYYNIKYPILNFKRFWHIRTFMHHILNWGIGFFSNIRKYKKFEYFFTCHTTKTNKTYSHRELMALPSIEGHDFSVFVCESDVIWKLYSIGGFDEIFFLDFPAAKGKRKVAYSPSLAARPFTKEEEISLKSFVADFYAISTREKQGADYLSKLLGRSIDWMLDPTLLLTAQEYRDISILPKERHYVLLYNCMMNDIKMVKQAGAFAEKNGLQLIEISNWTENKLRFNHKVITDAGIGEWLGYFEYADFVICNAFHGFCFSVIYHKEVFLFLRDKGDYRMKNITDELGMSERLIPCEKKELPACFSPIDYRKVDKKLMELRLKSKRFIESNIKD